MHLEIENAEAGKTQRTYARLAGILFLGRARRGARCTFWSERRIQRAC